MKRTDLEHAIEAEKKVADHLKQVKISLGRISVWQKRATYYRKKIHEADKRALSRAGTRRIDLE